MTILISGRLNKAAGRITVVKIRPVNFWSAWQPFVTGFKGKKFAVLADESKYITQE